MSNFSVSRYLARKIRMWLDYHMTEKPISIATPSTFEFINEDVSKQVAASRSILEVAEGLRQQLLAAEDESQKKAIYDNIVRLVKIANELSANAMTTATTASSTISSVIITPIKTDR